MTLSFVAMALLMLIAASSFIVFPLRHQAASHASGSVPGPWRWAAAWLVVGLAITAAALYGLVGEPAALSEAETSRQPAASVATEAPSPQDQQQGVTPARIEAMVQGLAQRLAAQPQDPAGWRMLARSYETLGRFDEAVQAYRRLMALQEPNADLLTDYAVTLAMSMGQTLMGEPEAAIDQALKLDPRHLQALALSGSAAFEARDYPRAVAQWQKLLALIPADSDMRQSIERNVAKAKALGH